MLIHVFKLTTIYNCIITNFYSTYIITGGLKSMDYGTSIWEAVESILSGGGSSSSENGGN